MSKRFSQVLALSAGFSLLVACQAAPPALKMTPALDGGAAGSRVVERVLTGRVVFPPSLKTQASAGDVVRNASVSLIDPGTGQTLVGGRTTASGAFVLMPDYAFTPADGGYYRLEVTTRLGGASAVGKNQVSLATVVKWSDESGWSSITSPEIVVNATTTAAVLIDSEVGAVSFSDLMGKVLGAPAYTTVTPIGGEDVTARAARVAAQLLSDEDPMGDRAIPPSGGRLYPGDTGDASTHHDFVLNRNGQDSVFVWIPVFTAYQLVQPANCGVANAGKPAGYWVKAQPAGTEGSDWVKETFGGFYVGKFEASRNDALPDNAGSGGSGANLKVQAGVVPWTKISWDDAAKACRNYDTHCRLMGDDHWTALAVWSMIEGLTVYGNNWGRMDVASASITFTPDPTTAFQRALTGTGTHSADPGVNLTTHTGTRDGVYDLNGNVTEWTANLEDRQFTKTYGIDDLDTGFAMPSGYVSRLSTHPLLRRYGVPDSIGGTSGSKDAFTALFSDDYFARSLAANAKSLRGGAYDTGAMAGVWHISFFYSRTTSTRDDIGFRPVIVF